MDGFGTDFVTVLSGDSFRGNAMFVGSVRVGTMLKQDDNDVNVAVCASEMKRSGTGRSDDRCGSVPVLVTGVSKGQS